MGLGGISLVVGSEFGVVCAEGGPVHQGHRVAVGDETVGAPGLQPLVGLDGRAGQVHEDIVVVADIAAAPDLDGR